jgi:hypothetical protein
MYDKLSIFAILALKTLTNYNATKKYTSEQHFLMLQY